MSDSRRQSVSTDARRQSNASDHAKGQAGRLPRASITGPKQGNELRRPSISNGQRVSNMGGKGPRSSRTATGSRINVASSGFPMDRIQVLDDDGVDRTPKPLILMKPSVMKGVPGLSTEYDSHTPTSDVSENFLDRISSSGFGRGGFSASTSGTQTPLEVDDEEDYAARKDKERQQARAWKEAAMEDEEEPAASSRWSEQDKAPAKPLTEEELDKHVYINLAETDTTFLLDIPGVSVHVEGEETRQVEETNARYQSLLTAKVGSDKYMDGMSQTLSLLKKNKEVQISSATTAAVGCQVSLWDIADSYGEHTSSTTEDHQQTMSILDAASAVGTGTGPSLPVGPAMGGVSGGSATASLRQSRCDYGGYPGRESSNLQRNSSVTDRGTGGRPMALLPIGDEGSNAAGGADTQAANPLLGLKGLASALAVMDAAITQNLYFEKLLMYRDVKQMPGHSAAETMEASVASSASDWPRTSTSAAAWDETSSQRSISLEQASSSHRIHMDLLWQWKCELTEGRNASCMCWNKARPDLLAVGYGSFSFGAQHEGLVAFWSLKNPDYPLWTFATKSGVVSLDFANHTPNILAVGLYDGKLAVYDVKNKQPIPAMESSANNGKHSDPVWKVRWLDRGPEREEVLVSISTDGRVTQWSITKGLEFTDLMKLKRVVRRNATSTARTKQGAAGHAASHRIGEDQEAFISRLTSGMSFDFSSRDNRMYIAGTEDGWIHKCSTSYSEQYLESYQGHMGPVYQVQWSPFKNDFFLSCGGDWTVRLWQEQHNSTLVVFQSAPDEVNDVQWSPFSSTVFGSVTAGGRLEIWDFAESTLKPVATHHHQGSKLSCVLFSPTSPVVMCGADDGSVSVHRIHYTDAHTSGKAEQLQLMDEALRANVMKTQPHQAGHD